MKLLLFLIFAFDNTNDSIKTELLNEVVVTANRIDNQSFMTPNSIRVINQKYLQNSSPRTTPEALAGINGVFVQKTNHGGGSPFVRGLTGNQTLLLIDGIRLNNSTFRYGPNQYFNTIDPFSLKKIEVLSGAGSVQYGSDALGGTIQVLTKEPEFSSKFRANFLGRIATHGMEQTARTELSYGTEKMAILGSFGFRNFGDLVGGKQTGRQSPSGYDEQMANLKAKLKIKKGLLTLSHQYFRAEDVPVYHKVVLENFALNEFNPQRRNLSYLKFHQKNESKFFNEISIITSLQATYEQRNSQKNNSTRLIEELDKVFTKGITTTIHSEFSYKWSANSGIEIYHDLVRSSKKDLSIQNPNDAKVLRGLYPDNSTFFNYSIFSLHQFEIKKWIFSGGLRYNGFRINIDDKDIGKSIIRPNALVRNLAISRVFSEKLNLYLSNSEGFRSPNIDDMGTLGIVDFRYEQPAYNLKPERSNTFEFGAKFRTNHFSSSAAIFYTSLQDLITRVRIPNQVINGYAVYQKENTEKAEIRGFEYDFEGILHKNLKIFGNLTYLLGNNITKNEPMRRIPPMNGRISLVYEKQKFFIRPELLFASAQTRLAKGDIDDNRIGKDGTAAWQVINIHSGIESKRLIINLLLQNLTNTDYRIHGSGINGVGRSAVLCLNFIIP